MVNKTLTHHGVKGMKWGVRRYQNKDGSLTAAGRQRYYGSNASTQPSKRDREILKDKQSLKRALQKLDPNELDDYNDDVLGKHSRQYVNKQREIYNKYADDRDKAEEKYSKLANDAGFDDVYDLDPSWRAEHDMGPVSKEGMKIWNDFCDEVDRLSKNYDIDTGENYYNNLLKNQLKDLKISDVEYGQKRLIEMGIDFLNIYTEYNLDD